MNKVASQKEAQMMSGPSPVFSLLQRKCGCGNHTAGGGECGQCSKKQEGSLQPKLEVSKPGDPFEREADRIAGQIMRMSAPTPEQLSHDGAFASMQRKSNGSQARAGTAVVDDVLSSGGQPLDYASRAFFEPRFGYDFSNVRVHADDRAAESAKAVGAKAYTVGEHVVFGSRQFSPTTTSGRELMAHELTHVIQQGRAEATRQPEEETEDSTLQTNKTSSVSRAPLAVSRQVTPMRSSGLRLQRAACPCCIDSISIGNIQRIDTPAQMGHSFDTTFALSYPASGPSGSCVLEWWEKTNVPAVAGHPPNVWTDMFQLMGGASFGTWTNRKEECATSTAVVDTDPPQLGRTPGRTVTRTLEFRIVVNSMPPTSEGGCGNATKQVTAKQVLKMTGGVPDWGASSFTTP
jgi:hypothetical protein